MVFDGTLVKAHAGLSGFARGDEKSLTLAAGARLFASPWLDVEAMMPWKAARGRDPEEHADIVTSGAGDLTLAAAFDALELLNPSLRYRQCPESGNWIWVPTDHFRDVKNPHLALSAAVSLPTGRFDILDADRCDTLDPRYQPGAGVWIPSLGLDYSQGFGSVFPALGVRWTCPSGEDATGLRRSPSWSFAGGLTWRSRGKEDVLAFDLSLACEWSPGESERDGVPLPGSRGTGVSLNLGAAVGLGQGYVLAAQFTWGISDNRGHAENPLEPGLGGGLYVVASCF